MGADRQAEGSHRRVAGPLPKTRSTTPPRTKLTAPKTSDPIISDIAYIVGDRVATGRFPPAVAGTTTPTDHFVSALGSHEEFRPDILKELIVVSAGRCRGRTPIYKGHSRLLLTFFLSSSDEAIADVPESFVSVPVVEWSFLNLKYAQKTTASRAYKT